MCLRTWLVEPYARDIRQRLLKLQCVLNQCADFFVFSVSGYSIMAFQHAACVGVDNEDRLVRRIEKHGIRSLGADAFQSEQLRPQLLSWSSQHRVKRTAMFFLEKCDEILQAGCLLA